MIYPQNRQLIGLRLAFFYDAAGAAAAVPRDDEVGGVSSGRWARSPRSRSLLGQFVFLSWQRFCIGLIQVHFDSKPAY
jgi:hypothetical protein